jgi:hypothetical protein
VEACCNAHNFRSEEEKIAEGERQLRKLGSLKEHSNEADFLGFLQKLVLHRSLTLPFEPGVDNSPTRRVGELATL